MADKVNPGLDDVLVAESDICFIDGDEGTLLYRGYPIQDLARNATYEEVLHLLWHGSLPNESQYDEFKQTLATKRNLDDDIVEILRALAKQDERPMVALRTAVSTLSSYDPDRNADPSHRESNLQKGMRITAKIPTILAAFKRLKDGADPLSPRADLDHAANFLYMLNGEDPDAVMAETLDKALVLHADHGINASTFSARVTASTLADIHSSITSAIGTLSGSWHGGANQDVMDMLHEVDDADVDPVEWAREALDEGRRLPGFGHRVYNTKDPRTFILAEQSEALAESAQAMRWHKYTQAIESFASDELGLAPNVDYYSAPTYHQMGIPVEFYTPIFAMSRVGGWIAHLFDQYEDNRLIRPRARYTGPMDEQIAPLSER